MKLNPSAYPDEVGFHHEVISSSLEDLFRRKTDLVEKSTDNVDAFFCSGPRLLSRAASREVISAAELPEKVVFKCDIYAEKFVYMWCARTK